MLPDDPSIACSLDREAGPRRQARWLALVDRALISHARTPDGARHRYRSDPGVEAELGALVALEADCCPFLDLRVTRDDGALVLDVSGPPEARPIVELFATGGEP